MTLAELRNSVWYWLDDLQGGYFTQPQVDVWLNNAQKKVQNMLVGVGQNFYLKCVETTLVVNQNEYVMPSNLKKVNSLYLIMSGTAPNETFSMIEPITTNEAFLTAYTNGTPQAYSITRSRLVLYPFPDQPLTLRLKYTYLVSDMELDTDVPDVPESYHELIALYAAQDGFIKDGRANDLIVKKIKEYEDSFRSDANERRQDRPRSIVKTGFSQSQSTYYW